MSAENFYVMTALSCERVEAFLIPAVDLESNFEECFRYSWTSPDRPRIPGDVMVLMNVRSRLCWR